jgi:hypothetical protein
MDGGVMMEGQNGAGANAGMGQCRTREGRKIHKDTVRGEQIGVSLKGKKSDVEGKGKSHRAVY